MLHPDGSLRVEGYDRVLFRGSESQALDLLKGQGEQLAHALEDGIVRGVWLTTVYGARTFVVCANVEVITEWREESLVACDYDSSLYPDPEDA